MNCFTQYLSHQRMLSINIDALKKTLRLSMVTDGCSWFPNFPTDDRKPIYHDD